MGAQRPGLRINETQPKPTINIYSRQVVHGPHLIRSEGGAALYELGGPYLTGLYLSYTDRFDPDAALQGLFDPFGCT